MSAPLCDRCKWCTARGCNEHEDTTGPYVPPPRLPAPTVSAPRTEAGKRLLDAIRSGVAGLFAHDDGPDDPSPIPGAIVAIEQEAIEQERARLVAGVDAVLGRVERKRGLTNLQLAEQQLAAVLALIRDTEGGTE